MEGGNKTKSVGLSKKDFLLKADYLRKTDNAEALSRVESDVEIIKLRVGWYVRLLFIYKIALALEKRARECWELVRSKVHQADLWEDSISRIFRLICLVQGL
ncbi:Uncharacterized protein APZ42_015508 [Daphnia magna]|uniref:Uncharacterized protein n=1 Tax=Daphnia magna TaxID=35525 RepID=A0A162PJ71_9CRUS|nr:Uncharacterized protein APZ42_015508 [Daphnia magna]